MALALCDDDLALLTSLVHVCSQLADSELKQLEMDQLELEQLRHQLADYFCEDVTTFQLDECISTLNTFIQQFIKAADVRLFTYLLFLASASVLHHFQDSQLDENQIFSYSPIYLAVLFGMISSEYLNAV